MREALSEYMSSVEAIFEELLIEYGLSMFVTAQFISGAGLLFFLPDAIVTPTFVMVYASSFLEVFAIATISAMALVSGNFLLYLFSRFLGERYISEEDMDTKVWRFLHWAVKKNARTSLVVLRFLPVGSGLVAIPAGLLEVKAKTFIAYSFIGFWILELSLGFGMWYGLEEGILQAYTSEVVPN